MKTPLLFLSLLLPLDAATRHVDGSRSGSGDGGSWATAFTTLQEALAASISGDRILIAAGTYFPDEGGTFADNDRLATFRLVDGVTIEGGYPNGGGARDLDANATVLSGDLDGNDAGHPTGLNSLTVVTAIGVGPQTVLDGLRVTGGLADGLPGDHVDAASRAGGGMRCGGASPTVVNCSFSGNLADSGGGVFCIDFSTPEFLNCVISGNAANFLGGGLNNRYGSSPKLTNCTFSGNSAGSFSGGGAISSFAASVPVLNNCIVWNNRAAGSTTDPASSIDHSGSAPPDYGFSLIQNIDPGGSNLDGTDPANGPDFLVPSLPGDAPSMAGDLRLALGSPALDAGNSSANTSSADILGAPRIQNGTIDLGAYEGGFEPLHPKVLHVDRNVATAGDGSSWASAFATIQEAMAAAVGEQSIHVAGGTYFPDDGGAVSPGDRSASFSLRNSIRLVGGFPTGGGPRDLAAHPTILSGDLDSNDSDAPTGGNSYSVVRAEGIDASAVLDGFIIEGGLADHSGSDPEEARHSGGGLHLRASSPRILNCWFRGNMADFGGAVEALDGSTPAFVNCAFSGNLAEDYGGAVNCREDSPASFLNCTLTGNSAGIGGGAIYAFSASSPSLTNCIVWRNAAGGSTDSPSATLLESSGFSVFNHSLLANLTPGGTNPDGIGDLNNPLFALPVDPTSAPTTRGDLRLSSGTACVDGGDDASISGHDSDLAGAPRIASSGVDLGAFEGGLPPADSDGDGMSDAFELAHTDPASTTSLSPNDDSDGDAIGAFEEFVLGLDPGVPDARAGTVETGAVESGESEFLFIEMTIRPGAEATADVTAEIGSDPSGGWSTDGTVPLDLPSPRIGARSDQPIGSRPAEFLRFRFGPK